MTTHTPGPWLVASQSGGAFHIQTGDLLVAQAVIASDMEDDRNSPDPQTALHNARLIAAAPDLLQSAVNLLDAVVTQCEYGKGSATDIWVIEARAAIAKATGETP